MANVDLLIPFILEFETGVIQKQGESLPLLFERSRKSGFANDPLDKGGATMIGVTIATYRQYRRAQGYPTTTADDLRKIPYNAWHCILKQMYWDRWQADRIRSQSLANILVDWVWGSGVHGIKKPQKILGVTQDGIVGNKTLSALNNYQPESELFNKIRTARLLFVEEIVRRNPSQRKWLNGWKHRINAIA